jgi:prephenate dehydrogenase
MAFGKVAVVGVGLIGGSFGLALKRKRLARTVVGVGRSRANLRKAMQIGAIDCIATVETAAKDADLILLATPVSHFEELFRKVATSLKPSAIVMDAGSTKRDVVAAARKGLGRKVRQFVPVHPIAGAERSGAAAADAGLFRGRHVVLTPLKESSRQDVEAVAGLWRSVGARVARMTPREHDAVFAAVSHLPHVLAYALVSDISRRRNAASLFSYAAGGFRDFTRIASSHPEMWRDICVANRDGLLGEMARFRAELRRVEKMLRRNDAGRLERLFADARAARQKWLEGGWLNRDGG